MSNSKPFMTLKMNSLYYPIVEMSYNPNFTNPDLVEWCLSGTVFLLFI